MAQIHILDSETIDKIAAGEVVERPASVVKELVENAIDAGATAVTVEIKDGGIEFIRVTDNGCGMEREQLRTAFLRHATSKIEDASDLIHISSLGFRGEALSSISAVAKVEVITKTAASITGSRIILEGAKEIAFDEIGAPEGTTFLVRNLFFNTPVRRKFLKQPATEGGYIADLMEHLALSRPDVSFKLVMGNQMKFHTSGNGDLREVIYRIYGREVANALVPVQCEKNGMRVEGYLGKPVSVRSNRNFEIYFINGRFVRSNVVARAIEEGYKEYLMQHKFPLCVLHITMDTTAVDVNVHPTKMDVRFSNTLEFVNFLTEAVRTAMQQREMIPDARLSTEREIQAEEKALRREAEKQHTPEPFEQKRSNEYRVMEEARYQADRPQMQEFVRNPVWNRVKGEFSGEEKSPAAGEAPTAVKGSDESFVKQYTQMPSRNVAGATQGASVDANAASDESEEFIFEETSEIKEETSAVGAGNHKDTGNSNGTENSDEAEKTDASDANVKPKREGMEEVAEPDMQSTQLNFFEEKILTVDNRSRFRMIGQVFDTYWLVEFDEKLLMIDQHAAHEKVNYERLMKQFREKAVVSQRLMPPVIVSLSAQEETSLTEHREVFESLGFEVEEFGGSEYALRSVPVDLYGCNEREMFLEVLDELSEGTAFNGIRVVEEKIASMSCKAAVKGNNKMNFAEAEALIDELLTLDNPYNCPHGRPTIVAMSKAEMERKFKRIVN